MPFTFAHPAAAVPLARSLGRWGVVSALALGSMAPDFAYWLPLGPGRAATHSLAAVVWFCVPTGLGAYWLVHAVLARPLVALMPAAVGLRIAVTRSFRWRDHNWAGVCLSLVVGALTHLVWDAFTHSDGAAVNALPLLSIPLVSISGYTIFVYKLLQHGGTLLGFVVLIARARAWIRATPPTPTARRVALKPNQKVLFLLALLIPGAVVGLAFGLRAGSSEPSLSYVREFARGSIVPGIGVVAASILLASALWPLIEGRLPHSHDTEQMRDSAPQRTAGQSPPDGEAP